MWKFLTIALLLVFASAIRCSAQAAPTADEYGVYSALFTTKGYDRQEAQMVIRDMTAIDELFPEHHFDPKDPEPSIQYLRKFLPELASETALDFFTKNQTSWTLKREFKLKAEVILVDSYEIDRMFNRDLEEGWKLFHTKYRSASSIDTLSRVGFNKEKTQAIIYYGYVCGPLCGQGQYILLMKTDNKWTVAKEHMTWIS